MSDRNSEIRPPVSRIRVTPVPYVADRWGVVHRVTEAETANLHRLNTWPNLVEAR